jgi:hypothetical protein
LTRLAKLSTSLSVIVSLAAFPAAAAQLTLSWFDNASNEAGFKIERKTGQAGSFEQVALVGLDTNTYSDGALTPGTPYCYRVRAYNAVGDSAPSNEACGLATTFRDVGGAHWAWPYVETLAALGVTAGCGSGSYCPDAPVTRAEMAVFILKALYTAAYLPPPASGGEFQDVPASYWAAAWIEDLAAKSITAGCGADRYCPQDAVTRAQMAVFLLRAKNFAGYQPPAATGAVFADVPASHWAAAWIERLFFEGVTSGCSPTTYCPESPITRAQMAVFLVRALGLPLLF